LFGRHWDRLEEGLNQFNVMAVIIVLVIAGVWWWRNRKNGKAAAGR
jgi:membrane protein DedA with SNARE-associated domain